MRRHLVVVMLILGACGAPAEAQLRFSEVVSSVEADVIGSAYSYLNVSIGDLEAGDTTWALQRLELRMTGRDGSTTIHLPTGSYLLDDTSITAANNNARSVTLFPEDRFEIIIRVGPDRPLRPGLHLVSFEVPVTENREGGQPVDGRLVIDVRHRVQDPSRRDQNEAFCHEVLPLVNGYVPDDEEVGLIGASAARHLTEAQAAEVSRQALQMLKDLEAFDAGETSGFNTAGLTSAVGEFCPGVEMLSVTSAR